jgi:alkylation response protein AidB-like acyl-CoA dehydrogenase
MSENNGLSVEHQNTFEAGLAHHLRTKTELDEALRTNADLRQRLTQAETENETLRSFANMMESRVASVVADRDRAVAEAAKYETLFIQLKATFLAFEIPAAPFIRKAEDAP